MNVPNILTIIRFLLIPIFFYEYLFAKDITFAVGILILSGVTDYLDGHIARKYNMITKWGIIFDPVADKLTQLTVSFCIAYSGLKVMWIAFIFLLVKELVLVFGGIKLYRKNDVVVSAKWYGKIATCLFYVVFVVLLLFDNSISTQNKNLIVTVAILFSILALVSYVINFFKIQKKLF